ncbi:MAG TPA: preprotein translocase subunit SecY [Ruminiclostridium sp.]|uniref:Protein translocase subunit SecY n=1 Tax=Acetivibrio saccincola TaxID=1677857 RepID=A0A2K9EFH7_9FIRM|nr:preprotein translocase subunit SecY [Acetivibrio saccincola]AUG58904.1 preprotein translocase subunit SecY [Acetivibrio saccincola]HAA43586.1 preprotein translocase subunit SecY [Ruminiclostridium sp.]
MRAIIETLRNAWKIADLRKRILVTLFFLLLFRLGAAIPVPGLNPDILKELLGGASIFNFANIIGGGALARATIFALGITPYITASIIMNLLAVAIPKLEQLAKEGEEGRKIMAQYTRYGTVVLAFLQATGFYFGLRDAVMTRGWFSFVTITLTFTAGTAILMWLGEQITEHGIGNGISLIIFAGILSQGPAAYGALMAQKENIGTGIMLYVGIAAIVLVFLAVVTAVVWVQEAERRIPVQYAKRVVGRKMYGGQSTHIPIKVNMAGVIPIIFASSFIMLPPTIVGFFWANSTHPVAVFFRHFPEKPWVAALNGVLIMFFTFFYTFIQFNPVELANNLKKNGGFIPGIRPGKPTSDYIFKVVNRITWFSAVFIAAIQLFPSLLGTLTKLQGVWIAGSSIMIMVGVALETVKQIESQMIMRHYKGFLE